MEADLESQSPTPLVRLFRAARALLLYGAPLAAGLALRLWMLKKLFAVNGDSMVYGGLARNLILHGQYALNGSGGEIYPTLIRLPGYPLFLVLCFRLFGMENYYGAACVQIALELAGCLLLASAARAITPAPRKTAAALATLWLAALCPFTASYSAAPLAETPTLFAFALAIWAAARFCRRPAWPSALWFTFAVTWAALLRPDGALAAIAFAPALIFGLRFKVARIIKTDCHPERAKRVEGPASDLLQKNGTEPRRMFRMALVCTLVALAPFVAWTARNWAVFHVFEPLAPRLAMDPGEGQNNGWEHWVKSWCLDFHSTYYIYWNVPGDVFDINKLPARAFDSAQQYDETAALVAVYNHNNHELTPELDARFEKLAEDRIAAHPIRYYVWLPLGRVADMWLRPRVENLPINLDWWVYSHHRAETRFSFEYAALNALYILLAIAGILLCPPFWKSMLAYMLMRSALLLTVEAPEARYTLECFPMLFVLGGIATAAAWQRVVQSIRIGASSGLRATE